MQQSAKFFITSTHLFGGALLWHACRGQMTSFRSPAPAPPLPRGPGNWYDFYCWAIFYSIPIFLSTYGPWDDSNSVALEIKFLWVSFPKFCRSIWSHFLWININEGKVHTMWHVCSSHIKNMKKYFLKELHNIFLVLIPSRDEGFDANTCMSTMHGQSFSF